MFNLGIRQDTGHGLRGNGFHLKLRSKYILFILICVPFTASDYVLMYWPFGLFWYFTILIFTNICSLSCLLSTFLMDAFIMDHCLRCRSVQYIIYVTAYVSIYTLVLMAGDRFLAVVCPVSSITIRCQQKIENKMKARQSLIHHLDPLLHPFCYPHPLSISFNNYFHFLYLIIS